MSRTPDEPPRRPKPPRLEPIDPEETVLESEVVNTWQPAPAPAPVPRPAPSRPAAKPRPAKEGSSARGARNLDEPKPYSGRGPGLFERVIFGSVGSGVLATFCRQLGAYLNAGVDIRKALASLEQQYARTALGPILGRLQLAIRRGEPLADAMAREPQAFDTFFLSMIRVAEARGGVPETLKSLAQHYESKQSLIRQARAALIYPTIVLTFAFGVIMLLSILLLPMFASMLRDIAGRGAGLPLPSRVLMGFSDFMQAMGWWLVPVAVIGGTFLLFRFYKTAPGKALLDNLALYVPVLGPLLAKIDTTRFARTLSALLEGGVDVGQSIDLTADVLQLTPFRNAVRNAKGAVMEGDDLSTSIAGTRVFAHDVIAILESGEETGAVPEALERLADDYEEQVTYMVKNLGNLIQPLLMIFLGGVVLFIILAVILPYISVITSLGAG